MTIDEAKAKYESAKARMKIAELKTSKAQAAYKKARNESFATIRDWLAAGNELNKAAAAARKDQP